MEQSKKPILASGKEETILKVTNLVKTYGEKKALKGVSFEIKNGEVVALIGLSGSGKSTLLRCINRMIAPTSGSIEFKYDLKIKDKTTKEYYYAIGECEIAEASRKELRQARKRIAMIFQHYNLVERVSALENVLHGRLGHMNTFKGMFGMYPQEEYEIAFDLLKDFGLKNEIYSNCSSLSGGQKQRVGIARGLIQNPNLMLCDEPIASLDPTSSIQIMEALRKVGKEKHVPVLVSLHQVEIAKEYADRIIAIKDGKIAFDDKPSKLTNALIDKIYKKGSK